MAAGESCCVCWGFCCGLMIKCLDDVRVIWKGVHLLGWVLGARLLRRAALESPSILKAGGSSRALSGFGGVAI